MSVTLSPLNVLRRLSFDMQCIYLLCWHPRLQRQTCGTAFVLCSWPSLADDRCTNWTWCRGHWLVSWVTHSSNVHSSNVGLYVHCRLRSTVMNIRTTWPRRQHSNETPLYRRWPTAAIECNACNTPWTYLVIRTNAPLALIAECKCW